MDPQAVQTPVQPDIGGQSLYDVIVIGGGPAGVGAAVYTARKQLKTLVIADSFGGQSIVSDDIQNWIGDNHISGLDFAKKLEAHVRSYPDMVDIKTEKAVEVKSIACTEAAGGGRMCDFEVTIEGGKSYKGKTVIVASGARRRKLGIPGEDQYGGKGVAYCSTCDAPLFKDKKVVVVGGGNAGLEAVQDLFPYASEINFMDRGDQVRGDAKTYSEIKKNPKLKEVILNAETVEVLGDSFVTGLKFRVHTPGSHLGGEQSASTGGEVGAGEEKVLEVGGIFVEIGSVPNSEMVKDLVQIDEHGQIIINFQHARTSHPGIFAAGDVTNDPYKQNNISAGDGVRAALAAYAYLLDREKNSPAAERPNV